LWQADAVAAAQSIVVLAERSEIAKTAVGCHGARIAAHNEQRQEEM
jgi:hypothetical protein